MRPFDCLSVTNQLFTMSLVRCCILNAQVNPSMHATKQSTAEEEMRPHLRMQEGRHANIESTGEDQDLIAHRLKRFEGKHSGRV